MISQLKFEGFSKQTIKFLRDLKNNNSKQWFEENRDIFNNHLMLESQLFVIEMGEKLQKIARPDDSAFMRLLKNTFDRKMMFILGFVGGVYAGISIN